MASSNTVFRFKQFAVHQERTAMKVGTDGVLLGVLAQTSGAADAPLILDIGTGTGLVALMLAQRFPSATVTAVEIDPDAAAQAIDNCGASPFAARINVVLADANEFETDVKFDLIVSNPPYFTDQLQCPDGRRNMARHTVGLDHSALMRIGAKHLAPTGRMAIIVPADAAVPLVAEAQNTGLALVAKTTIFSNRRKPARRAICQFRWAAEDVPTEENELTLLNLDGSISTEYQDITKDFYLDKQ
ncbi:MAG: methyltransferase [Bacteroidales bacterium]|nr:methyltransferase [Bacteroidales bacterium]